MSINSYQKSSDYLLTIKNWKIRRMVAGYLEASEQFHEAYSHAEPKIAFPFKSIEHICNILYELKEDHHTIFRRVVGPEKVKQEDRHKLKPGQADIDFIANVGRLFHKALVARELKYLHKHYDPLRNNTTAAADLILQLQEIDKLFKDGVPVLVEFIRIHAANVLLLALLLEKPRTVRRTIGVYAPHLLRQITGQNNLLATYYLVGKYYLEGGWYQKAEKMLHKILRNNPKHAEARKALDEIKIRKAAMLERLDKV